MERIIHQPRAPLTLIAVVLFVAACTGDPGTTVVPEDTQDTVEVTDTWFAIDFVKVADLPSDTGIDTFVIDIKWDLGIDATGEWGKPCQEQEDCGGGLCIQTSVGSVCTDLCIEDCPSGWACKGVNLFGGDLQFICVPMYWHICEECISDEDCEAPDAVCIPLGDDGTFCSALCDNESDCPPTFLCEVGDDADGNCVPPSGSCLCAEGNEVLTTPCEIANELGTCQGEQPCLGADGWGECNASTPIEESCDGTDEDCDGTIDEGFPDLDGDKEANCVDDDDDGDGDPDIDDCAPMDPTIHHDAEEICDGVDNNCDGETDEGSTDTDGDGLKDCWDDDDDNDGVLDTPDNCPLDSNPNQLNNDADAAGDVCDLDDDNDDILDEEDNCPFVPNFDQADMNDDGEGDACDDDIDGDGYPNNADCAPEDPAINPNASEICDHVDNNCDGFVDEGFIDTDGDELKNCVDPDDDNDEVLDEDDNCSVDVNPLQEDEDDDGLGDVCDDDDDGDGVPDDDDNCPMIPNEAQTDTDDAGRRTRLRRRQRRRRRPRRR